VQLKHAAIASQPKPRNCVLYVMSRAQLRELVMLFAICSVLTLAVFFLALWLLPFERLPLFSFPRFSGFPLI
jgi:hypothetical protein